MLAINTNMLQANSSSRSVASHLVTFLLSIAMYSPLLSLCLMSLLNLAIASDSAGLFPRNGFCDLCPKEKIAALASINRAVAGRAIPECGPGVWRPVAEVDVTGADQTCPGEWSFLNTFGCTRPFSVSGGCSVASFCPPGRVEYSRVCGRITGRASGSPNGFSDGSTVSGMVDGVTLTYAGSSRHIWSFAAAGGTSNAGGMQVIQCPCNPSAVPTALDSVTVAFTGNNFFCEAAVPSTNDLWDDADCTAGTPDECCSLNPNPYFSVTLDLPTTEDIEARICTGMATSDEQVFVREMEIFIQ